MEFTLKQGETAEVRIGRDINIEDLEITISRAPKVVEQPVYKLIVSETPRYRQIGNIIIIK